MIKKKTDEEKKKEEEEKKRKKEEEEKRKEEEKKRKEEEKKRKEEEKKRKEEEEKRKKEEEKKRKEEEKKRKQEEERKRKEEEKRKKELEKRKVTYQVLRPQIRKKKAVAPEPKTKRSVIVHKTEKPVGNIYDMLGRMEMTIQELARIYAELPDSRHYGVGGRMKPTLKQEMVADQLRQVRARSARLMGVLAKESN